MTKLEWALYHAENGFWVFPLRENTKFPIPSGWNDRATTDPDIIRGWWTARPDCNIGIACGPSKIGVVDLDMKNGKDGPLAWAQLQGAMGPAAHTAAFETASGGLHLIYRDPKGLFPNTAGLIGPGIDTRGPGGFIVAPGSTINGNEYTIAAE